MMYDRGGPLIDNERLLAGYMNCSIRKWRQLRADLIAKGKISITRDGMISNSRARKEIENASKTHRKLIEAGAKGGRTRAEKEQNSNENNGSGQASLEAGSSHAQAIRADSRNQKLEEERAPKPPSLPDDVKAVLEAGGFASPPGDLGLMRQWYEAGADLNDMVTVIGREAAKIKARGHGAPRTLKIFDASLREKLADDARQIEHLRKVARRNMDDPAPKAFDENRAAGAAR
jgi:uncharacterized protein YdaU (DUF1376 family)